MACCIARKGEKARGTVGKHRDCRDEESRSSQQWRNAACRLSWSVVLLSCLCYALNGAKVAALDTDPCQAWSAESNALPSGDHVLTTDGALYTPYKRLKVSLTGPFSGLLMQAKMVGSSTNNSSGMFTDLPDFAGTQSCQSPHDTLFVDGNSSNLNNISVTWIAPGLSAGEVQIIAQVKTDESDTWLLVKSSVIYDNVSLYEDHMGTAFSFMLMDIGGDRYQPEAYITTLSESSIPVNIITGSQSHHSNLLASKDRPGFDRLSTRARLSSSVLEKKGLLVSAQKDLGVVVVNKDKSSLDGFLVLPNDALGTEYFAVSYTPSTGQHSQLGVTPAQDRTLVSVALPPGRAVTVRFGNKTYNEGDIITVGLDVLQALQIQSDDDLTGTRVYSNKPVAVFSGNDHGSVSSLKSIGQFSTDHMVEQLLPVKSWGRRFVVIPFPDRPNGSILRIVASETSTVVTLSDNRTAFLSRAGDYEDVEIHSNLYYWVESNEPVQVVQFSKSHVPAGNVADAAMSLVPSIEQHSNHYWFITPDGSRGFFENNYAMIAVEEPYKDGIYIEGISFQKSRVSDLDSAEWTPVPGSAPLMMATTVQLKMNVYHVLHENDDVMFQLVLTGHTENECYAMPMGLRLYHTNEKKCVPRPQEGVDMIDNDCDGHVDEERCDGQDDDGDGYIDEDCFYFPTTTTNVETSTFETGSEKTFTDHGVTTDSYDAESKEDQRMFGVAEICGMAAGGILLIFLIILIVILRMRRRRRQRQDKAATNDTAMEEVSSNAPSSVIASVSSFGGGRTTSLGQAPSVSSSGYQSEALAAEEEEEEEFETIY